MDKFHVYVLIVNVALDEVLDFFVLDGLGVAFDEILLVMTPGGSSVLSYLYLHLFLGIVIIGLAFCNFSCIRKRRVMVK